AAIQHQNHSTATAASVNIDTASPAAHHHAGGLTPGQSGSTLGSRTSVRREESTMSLDASFYHRLTNKFQGPGQSLDVKPDGSRHRKMAATGDYSGQYWRLVDLGRGRYALRTQYLGDCFSLDVINDGRNETPWLNETGNYSGQFWSLTPWGDGTYKLTNDFTGPGKSLNVYAGSFEPFVGAGDHSGQHWVLTPLR